MDNERSSIRRYKAFGKSIVTEYLSDAERQLILVLVTKAMVEIASDPEMTYAKKECDEIIRLLSDPNIRVGVERTEQLG